MTDNPTTPSSWAEESTRAFFAQWLRGEDLEGAMGWCESLLKTQREAMVKMVEGMIKTDDRSGNWGHTYNQGKRDGWDSALSAVLTKIRSNTQLDT